MLSLFGIMTLWWLKTEAGWLKWYHVYGSSGTAKCMQTKYNNLISTQEAGLTPREPSISYDVYDFLPQKGNSFHSRGRPPVILMLISN